MTDAEYVDQILAKNDLFTVYMDTAFYVHIICNREVGCGSLTIDGPLEWNKLRDVIAEATKSWGVDE